MTKNGVAIAAVPELAAWSADVFVERDRPAAQPVLGLLLMRGCITLMTGPRSVGKSWLALAMAHAAARGGALAGWRARAAQRVVYVDAASGEVLLRARLAALAPAQPPSLVLAPGDAQAHGLPDLASAAGRDALDRLVTDADLVVVDGLSTLVQAGRGVGARWAALAEWLRSLRRRGVAVLLVEASEPRAIAALADTVLRLERPADATAEPGLRMTVRVAASRTPAEEMDRSFGLHMALRESGAVWTRQDAIDHRALTAWRLWERDYSTRDIARMLGVSPATAWRLVERGEKMPAHIRERAELPELEEERREQAARRKRRALDRAALILRQAQDEGLGEAQDEDRRVQGGDSGSTITPRPELVEGREAAAALPEGGGAATANSPEAVKQAPATIDAVATADLVPVLLARRRWWQREQAPPADWLAPFDYQTLFCAARARLSARGLNRLMLDDDRRPTPLRLASQQPVRG
jgi:DNA-binding CsgD family transcriptional regulator